MLTAGHRLAVLSNGALKFSRVTLGDAGSYQCLAKNEAGVAVGRTKLILHGNVGLKLKDGTNIYLLLKLSLILKRKYFGYLWTDLHTFSHVSQCPPC